MRGRRGGDRVAQRLRAPGDRVLVDVVVDGLRGRVLQLGRAREVREALGQADRTVLHGQPVHLADDRLGEAGGLGRDARVAHGAKSTARLRRAGAGSVPARRVRRSARRRGRPRARRTGRTPRRRWSGGSGRGSRCRGRARASGRRRPPRAGPTPGSRSDAVRRSVSAAYRRRPSSSTSSPPSWIVTVTVPAMTSSSIRQAGMSDAPSPPTGADVGRRRLERRHGQVAGAAGRRDDRQDQARRRGLRRDGARTSPDTATAR